MSALLDNVDPDGLLEYSVVYTDRSLNHMSQSFQAVMNDISSTLKEVYNAKAAVVVPGSGTFGMEAVARQFASDKKCLVLRNGWFSYRWTQIFDMGKLPSEHIVMKATQALDETASPFSPAAIDEVVATIKAEKPAVVFAPHVETSSGIILPQEYLQAVGDAVRSVGGLFVLDCIASGTIWVDMETNNVDVLISAPQKGWSGPPCAGLVMMNDRALAVMEETTSSSFAMNLKQWHQIMKAYEGGAHAYHATMPTDALRRFRDIMLETREVGFEKVKAAQYELGEKVRALLASKGIVSVAANGFGAPGVVVCYTQDSDVQTGKKFGAVGMQIAAGVPLQCDEREDYKTFRLGLFGLDKLMNVDRTVASLETALNEVM
ncbi:aminotransferase class V-fold PLP-dependent enzyme [Leucothrix arctica]|uniref:Aminotransferase n=1 Tax=Leucothrix arctica TaxID=1481894 RepID=A0A317CPZ2_9GAMM|nr:aminotransferase class V-fold PLP-dependent enzyme [Leucothrix arctica]PWQ99573.1 aminotransferase [Leucothrix arctica]